ncbi:hypothetical protein EV183_000628 [Coemansia sp. RSA 2336]|nr:hypothetical protein EV183_000628 [Coemansia sp. RSA 2336]
MKRFLIVCAVFICSVPAFVSGTGSEDDPDDINIDRLLGIRPDLADDFELGESSTEKEDKASVQAGCISECKDTDQSCRARCLGVPGVASRKMPRKQDINGNLPLNWRKDNAGSQRLPQLLWWATSMVSVACLS